MNGLHFHSHRAQLLLTALSASAVTFTVITLYNAYVKNERRRALDRDVTRSIAKANDSGATAAYEAEHIHHHSHKDIYLKSKVGYDEELIREQLARNYAFFGEDGMTKVRQGKVVIVGCGGVGSWAAVMLVRSGVTNIRLVDFDYVTLSSLNRHATAVLTDVGTPKVKCMERTLKQISRWVEVDAQVDIWRKEEGGKLLQDADWVVDAIDNISTKVDLLRYCHEHKIKVFSSMGSGLKSDPTRIQISDISATIYDPLARSVRRRLRLQGVQSGIPVVYSTEVPSDVKLLPLPEEEFQKGNVKELGVYDDFRVRTLPVLGPLPSIFGLHIATYILCELAEKPITNPLPIKYRKKLYERMLKDLLNREQKTSGQVINKLPLDEDDVSLIFEDLHRGRSVIPPHSIPARPVLVRWDPHHPLTLENTVVMDQAEGKRHVQGLGTGDLHTPAEVWGDEVQDVVNRRAKELEGHRQMVL